MERVVGRGSRSSHVQYCLGPPTCATFVMKTATTLCALAGVCVCVCAHPCACVCLCVFWGKQGPATRQQFQLQSTSDPKVTSDFFCVIGSG